MGERGLGRGPWKQIFGMRTKSGVSEGDGEAKFGRGIGERGLNLGRVTGGRRAEKQNLEWGQGARLGRKFERQSSNTRGPADRIEGGGTRRTVK